MAYAPNMPGDDPVLSLVHDHADLNRQLLAISVQVAKVQRRDFEMTELVAPLSTLRELLFLHFAREEEGLFPVVSDVLPALAEQVHEMALAHDAICGGLARMIHLATVGGDPGVLAGVFERFELAYSAHARAEAELLEAVGKGLSSDHRARLAALVDGL